MNNLIFGAVNYGNTGLTTAQSEVLEQLVYDSGNLNITATGFIVDAPLIEIGHGNATDDKLIGFFGTQEVNKHTGLFRDYNTNTYKLFKDAPVLPDESNIPTILATLDTGGILVNGTAVSTEGHTHPQSDITDLTTDLSNKAPLSHTHPQSDITNLITDLSNKAPLVHTHPQSDITNLTTDLSNKLNTTDFGTTFDQSLLSKSTDDLSEGTVNKYQHINDFATTTTSVYSSSKVESLLAKSGYYETMGLSSYLITAGQHLIGSVSLPYGYLNPTDNCLVVRMVGQYRTNGTVDVSITHTLDNPTFYQTNQSGIITLFSTLNIYRHFEVKINYVYSSGVLTSIGMFKFLNFNQVETYKPHNDNIGFQAFNPNKAMNTAFIFGRDGQALPVDLEFIIYSHTTSRF